MNLLSQLNSLLSSESISVATIVGSKGGGVWVGETMGGGVVLLTANERYATGTKVYYNALTGAVIGTAPNVEFQSYGV